MKKMQLNAGALQLKKNRITELQAKEAENVQGGFTYSLSMGARCKVSKAAGADDPYQCGILVSMAACPAKEEGVQEQYA